QMQDRGFADRRRRRPATRLDSDQNRSRRSKTAPHQVARTRARAAPERATDADRTLFGLLVHPGVPAPPARCQRASWLVSRDGWAIEHTQPADRRVIQLTSASKARRNSRLVA